MSHQGNVNESHSEIHLHQTSYSWQDKQLKRSGENVEQPELLCPANGTVNWHNPTGNLFDII